ncbi:MAG TPA: acyl-ACP--UDP-N-acetylglucosamine O-acyltransferase [Planctomycetota bacterium]|nr:acyl-ACP--UDP-N-acetylglucosamine O-acyltransferase [Planctomycetota bacterium]
MSNPSEYHLRGGAWVHVRARLPEDPGDIALEPGAVIGADVEVGPGSWIGAHAVLSGPMRMGEKNQIFPTAILGGPPQDLSYAGQPTRLEIGDRNIFREGVSAHRASAKANGVTRIGSDNYFMGYCHIGHDCIIDDHVILANGVLLGGHCHIQSFANLAGGCAAAHCVTIGRHAFVCGTAGVRRDLEPFISHDLRRANVEPIPACINEVGLKRAGISAETIQKLKSAYKVLYLKRDALVDMARARSEIEARGAICPEVEELLGFIERKRQGRFGRARTK